MSRVYNRPIHQAYERRAKQDQTAQMISNQFLRKEEDAKRNALIAVDTTKAIIEQDEEMRLDLISFRLYGSVNYVGFLCNINQIDNPLNVI